MASIKICQCGGWMRSKYNETDIVFECMTCGAHEIGDDTDRNRRTGDYVDSAGIQLRKLLKHATVDPVNPRNFKKCPKKGCPAKLVVYVETQKTKKKIYKCPACNTVFD